MCKKCFILHFSKSYLTQPSNPPGGWEIQGRPILFIVLHSRSEKKPGQKYWEGPQEFSLTPWSFLFFTQKCSNYVCFTRVLRLPDCIAGAQTSKGLCWKLAAHTYHLRGGCTPPHCSAMHWPHLSLSPVPFFCYFLLASSQAIPSWLANHIPLVFTLAGQCPSLPSALSKKWMNTVFRADLGSRSAEREAWWFL